MSANLQAGIERLEQLETKMRRQVEIATESLWAAGNSDQRTSSKWVLALAQHSLDETREVLKLLKGS